MPDPANDVEPRCYRHPDRETLVRCSACERPICTSCMHSTPVGIRCAECAGAPTGVQRVVQQSYRRGRVPVTLAIIVVTVVMFGAQVATSAARGARGGLDIFGGVTDALDLFAPDVANGEWWRIFSVALTHGGIAHVALNMISLWVIGSIVEAGLGPARYFGIYVAAIAWGSAGAMLLEANSHSVGASGGIFGLLAALIVVQRLRGGRVSGDIIGVFVFNLALTWAIPGISKGGHLGGIVGGAIAAAVAVGLERRVPASRRSQVALGGLVAVIVVGVVLSLLAAQRGTHIVGGS